MPALLNSLVHQFAGECRPVPENIRARVRIGNEGDPRLYPPADGIGRRARRIEPDRVAAVAADLPYEINSVTWNAIRLSGSRPNLKNVHGIYVDPEGMELPGEAKALAHAREVAMELMQRRERRTCAWRLQTCDADRKVVFDLLFATVDHTMHELPPVRRQTVETVSARAAGLSDTIRDVRTSIYQLRGMLAKSEGAPYLAAVNGSRIEP